ncbi:SRPBCC family protein [Nocardioides sp. J2M5]|uniref:SRPBCC family protein n=1 Tax=Nocardioides palaemonis TaxID=2829810 RepID=UPI001BA9D3D5|nr:SRPBCC family protein [Nocardioides palaemonis]MBS2937212.1 SRPBCC family protein [Nocardioides palaemonis]
MPIPSADRELRAERLVAAPPSEVWAALTDLSRMPDWSPELVRMVALRPGGLRVGQHYLGINRRRAVVWPTHSVVTLLEEGVVLAWDTRSSGSRWIYELSPEDGGTRVVHRRPVPDRLTRSGRVFATLALGGGESHADELEAGMARTLEGLAAAAQR